MRRISVIQITVPLLGLYGAMFIIPVGMSMQSSAVVGWSPINYYDLNVRAVAVATIVMIGNSGGIVSSYLYPSTTAPHYGTIFHSYSIQAFLLNCNYYI